MLEVNEIPVEASRRFIDKNTGKLYHGNDIIWITITDNKKVIHNGYFVKESLDGNPNDWIRVEPSFKKVKYKVKSTSSKK